MLIIFSYKPRPAKKAAEEVRRIAAERKKAEKLYRVLKYQLEYYENLFPWLIDFKGEDLDALIRQLLDKKVDESEELIEREDPARQWLTQAEYANLSSVEKFQKALDRYWQKKKSKWEIGRDYERFIGYKYESDGWQVYYQGIVEGLADLGRDLIVARNNEVEIVQCKYWSKDKLIHEKHIFQLYGTVVAYKIDNPGKSITAKLVTSTKLSDRAKQFARELMIKYAEEVPLEKYPSIKCNVSRLDSTKIYHLPFDQQYDKTVVEKERRELYVETVEEAERLGFRRAYRWRGNKEE